jgi:primary-amine oxidase
MWTAPITGWSRIASCRAGSRWTARDAASGRSRAIPWRSRGRSRRRSAQRSSRVESAAKRNAQGYPTGYRLEPGHTGSSILAPDDPIQVRAGFTAYTLWFSAYGPGDRFAAGAYPNENPEADGLPKWVATKRPIDGRDLVLWYPVGFRHVPRADDWPAMPGLWHGFRLRPSNFFDRNPALDVPPVDAAAK